MRSFFTWAIEKISGMSILIKSTVVFVLITIVPVLIFVNNIYSQQINNILGIIQQNTFEKISNIKQNIKNVKSNVEKATEQIIFGNELEYFMNPEQDISPKEWTRFISSLQDQLLSLRFAYTNLFYKVRLYSDNFGFGDQKEVYDIIYNIKRLENLPEYKSIVSGENRNFWGNTRKVEDYPEMPGRVSFERDTSIILPYYCKIYHPITKEFLGIIEIDLLLSKLMSENLMQFGSEYSILVYDSDWQIVAQYNAPDIIQSFNPAKVGSSDKGVLDIGGQNIVYEKLNDVNSVVVIGVYKYKKEIVQLTQKQRVSFILISIITIVLISLFIWTIINLMFKRLRKLVKVMDKLEKGNFDVKIKVQGNDEIAIIYKRFNQMANKLKENLISAIQKETAQKDAELKALQLQINPHFLYNVLENLRMECEIRGESDLADTLVSLSDFFRYSIKNSCEIVTLETELTHLENYITIMKIRYQNKLVFSNNINPAHYGCKILKVTFQPLVENCFKHAFHDMPSPWKIEICTEVRDGSLCIKIKDNGKGISADETQQLNEWLEHEKDLSELPHSSNSIGIFNVNKRIKMYFGSQYGIKLYSIINVGTEVVITLPLS
jgi:two-component system sensor histidine kinase YesM